MSPPPESLRTDDTALRRAIWRFEYGQLSDRRIKRLFRAAYLRAARDFTALEAGVPAVRRHDPALLAGRDAFRARADDALRGEHFRAALDEILRGRRTLATMQALVQAAARIDQAAKAVERLHDHARVPRLRALPCIQAPAELLAAARARTAAKRYAQARYLAEASLAESSPLERRERASAARREALEARIDEVRSLCASTRALAGENEADPVADGSLEAVAALARDGLVALAERMADEVAFSLAARGRLHRELCRAGAQSPDDAAVLRGTAAGAGPEAWAWATAALWRSRVEAGMRRVAAQRDRIEHARALLDAGATAGARGSEGAGREAYTDFINLRKR
ncbi:hypothetical protein [Longimicrobium sp.]|uniref:hypothetical protein n=1 Tax=Longimicrobium sp. TaxID=2029185 RepID=UPI002BCD65DC|nr:hypothetical protein [Longimicrobium sp.]HSU17500.1 hypothetical protein [Longimicrobium sp.]